MGYPGPNNVIRLSCTFTSSSGVDTDPTTITVNVKPPTGPSSTYTPARDSTGQYHYDLTVNQPGLWKYRFVGTGNVEAQSDEYEFTVDPVTF